MGRSRSRSRSRERGRRRSPSPERWSKRSRSRSRTPPEDEKSRRTRRTRRSPSPAAARGGDEEDWKREAERREEARKRWSVSPERKPRKKGGEDETAAGANRDAPVYEPGSVEAQMAALGLPVEGFASTKGLHVEGNDDFVVADVPHQRKYRQYMNKRVTKSVKVPVRR